MRCKMFGQVIFSKKTFLAYSALIRLDTFKYLKRQTLVLISKFRNIRNPDKAEWQAITILPVWRILCRRMLAPFENFILQTSHSNNLRCAALLPLPFPSAFCFICKLNFVGADGDENGMKTKIVDFDVINEEENRKKKKKKGTKLTFH